MTHSCPTRRASDVRAADKGLDLRIEFPATMPTVLRADHGRVRQVLLNYLSNSVKFTERGSVVVQVSAAALDNAHRRVRIAVRDTGVGIAAENHERLFQSFTQADASTTRRSEEHTSELQSLMRIPYAVFCL